MTTVIQGTGTTITFGTSGFTADLVTITRPEKSREAVDTTHLGTVTAKTSEPGKLYDPGQYTMEFVHDPEQPLLIAEDSELITVTYPLVGSQVTPSSFQFTGYSVSDGGEEFSNDTRVTTKITLQVTGPEAFTAPT